MLPKWWMLIQGFKLQQGCIFFRLLPPKGGGKKKLIYKKREKKKLEIYALWRELAYLEIKTLFCGFKILKRVGEKRWVRNFSDSAIDFFFSLFFLTYLEGKEKVEIYALWRE